MFKHGLRLIDRDRLDTLAGLDIAGNWIQKRTDGSIFALAVDTADDGISVLVEFECHPGTSTFPQCQTDRLGQSDLGFCGNCGYFGDDRRN